MERDIMNKIIQIQETVWMDPAFQSLASEHQVLNSRFLKAASLLPPEQQAAIYDYVGLLIEIQNKMLEYVCTPHP